MYLLISNQFIPTSFDDAQHIAILISVPAFIYSLGAVIGLGYEIIIWGIILLMVGIPIYVNIKLSNSKKSRQNGNIHSNHDRPYLIEIPQN